MNAAMILAAGRGERCGGALPKQFVEVLGKPVIAYAMEAFQRSPLIDAIEVVCQPEYMARVDLIARHYGIDKLRLLAAGGETCPASIRSGVYALRGTLADDDILLMHMAVSPLITPETVARAVEVCREKGCSFAAYPINICMALRTGGDWADEAVYKEDYIELNAPWTFRYGAVLDLYREADRLTLGRDPRDYTVNLWLATGRRAHTYRGSDEGRLKITTPHDLRLFEALLRMRGEGKADEAIRHER